MSKAAYWQRGESLDYKNTGTEKIEANSIIVLGSRIGVAGMDIAPGATEPGSLHVVGVFSFPKAGEAIEAGAEVFYSEADGNITATASGNIRAGFAVESAEASADKILVKINA